MAERDSRAPRLAAAPDDAAHRRPALPAKDGEQAEPGDLELDEDRVDAAVLAVLLLTAHQQGKGEPWRVWKGVDWEATDRLHEKGYIGDPVSKAKSVVLTEAGFARRRALLRQLCGPADGGDD